MVNIYFGLNSMIHEQFSREPRMHKVIVFRCQFMVLTQNGHNGVYFQMYFTRQSQRPPPEPIRRGHDIRDPNIFHRSIDYFGSNSTSFFCCQQQLQPQQPFFTGTNILKIHPPSQAIGTALIITLSSSEMALLPKVSSSLVVERSNEKPEVSWLPGNSDKRSSQNFRYVSSV